MNKIDELKKYCEEVIEDCEGNIAEYDELEYKNLDEDEMYSYAANEGMRNMAQNVLYQIEVLHMLKK